MPTSATSKQIKCEKVLNLIDRLNSASSKAVPKAGVLNIYKQATHFIPAGVDPFKDIGSLFLEMLTMDELPDTYQTLLNKIPLLPDLISMTSRDPDQFKTFCAIFLRWARNARTEDTSSAKSHILDLLLLDPDVDQLNPPIAFNKTKIARGFNHPMTARLLCPRKDLHIFDENPDEYMAKVKAGDIKIFAGDLPTFLYDESVEFNSEEQDGGLFEGYLAIRVYRTLFTGPSSGVDGKRQAAKRSKSELQGITEVTAATIAYACVQTRFALSAIGSWSPTDGCFNLIDFYDHIYKLLSDKRDPWTLRVLAQWNSAIPALQRNDKTRSNFIALPHPTLQGIDLILARKAERLAQIDRQSKAAGGGGTDRGLDLAAGPEEDHGRSARDSESEDGNEGGGEVGAEDDGESEDDGCEIRRNGEKGHLGEKRRGESRERERSREVGRNGERGHLGERRRGESRERERSREVGRNGERGHLGERRRGESREQERSREVGRNGERGHSGERRRRDDGGSSATKHGQDNERQKRKGKEKRLEEDRPSKRTKAIYDPV